MTRGPIIREVNIESPGFQRTWKRLPQHVKDAGIKAIQALLLPPDQRPAKLHLHKMHGQRESIWSLHLSSDDRYKASFILEGPLARFRRCGTHEEIDRNP